MIVKKYSKLEVCYTDDHGSSSEQCSKCEYYTIYSCEIVRGEVLPGGWCNQFERKK